jgi:hypothetical protein
MSQRILVSQAVIKMPCLLKTAVDTINSLKKHPLIGMQIKETPNGIQGASFFYNQNATYFAKHVNLQFVGSKTIEYDQFGSLTKGHFVLRGDEDFEENRKLGSLIGDHYIAQSIKTTFESRGYAIGLEFGADDTIQMTREKITAPAGY